MTTLTQWLPAEIDTPPASPLTDLHCPQCGGPFPGTTTAQDGETALTLCCGETACFGADDGDCGCVTECHTCPRPVLLAVARRDADGRVFCARCEPVAVPEAVKAAGRAALAAKLATLREVWP